MLEEVIWVSAASTDYLDANPIVAPTEAIDGLIELIRLFPEIGGKVNGSQRLRRALVGKQKIYGLFYATRGTRLIVVALLDLRQEPAAIESILQSRIP